MSGGHFDYYQYHITDIANSLEDYIYGHKIDEDDLEGIDCNPWIDKKEKEYIKEHHHTEPNESKYSEETIELLQEGLLFLRIAEIYAQRADYLISDDDGENSFKERLREDLSKLYETEPIKSFLDKHAIIIEHGKFRRFLQEL